MQKEKKPYPIKGIINWYIGNYCERKCFDKPDRILEHREKLLTFAEKNPNLTMRHKEFLDLFNNHMTICTLEDGFKRRSIGWNLFENLQNISDYDSNKIIVKNNSITTKKGNLSKPVYDCTICEKHHK